MKMKVWLDSGANIHSCREQIIDTEELGFTDEEWEKLADDDKDDIMRDVAWDKMEWGYAKAEE